MDPFLFALALGLLGLVAMAALGLGARGHGHAPSSTHAGHAAHGHATHAGHATHGSHAGHGKLAAPTATSPFVDLLATIASPRVIFSVAFGFGAVGHLVRPYVREPWPMVIALAGGVLFEAVLVAPLWKLLFRFASKPAENLGQALYSRAHAATSFDRDGNGLVRIEIDGQVVQLLGTLSAQDRAGVRVQAGDELVVEEVDEVRQRCRVSRR